jgi:hypothetical protein
VRERPSSLHAPACVAARAGSGLATSGRNEPIDEPPHAHDPDTEWQIAEDPAAGLPEGDDRPSLPAAEKGMTWLAGCL